MGVGKVGHPPILVQAPCGCCLNIIWFVLAGVWMAIGYAFAALICFILIITIPSVDQLHAVGDGSYVTIPDRR